MSAKPTAGSHPGELRTRAPGGHRLCSHRVGTSRKPDEAAAAKQKHMERRGCPRKDR